LPEGWGKLGETFELDLERSQRNFLPEPGNRAITVRWRRKPADDEPEITVIELELESLVAIPARAAATTTTPAPPTRPRRRP
jgi:hypothetical protein